MKRLVLNSVRVAVSVAVVGLIDAAVRAVATGTRLPIEQYEYGLVFLVPIYLLLVLPGTVLLDVLMAQSRSPRTLAIVACTAAGLLIGLGLSVITGDIRPLVFLAATGLSSGLLVRPPELPRGRLEDS